MTRVWRCVSERRNTCTTATWRTPLGPDAPPKYNNVWLARASAWRLLQRCANGITTTPSNWADNPWGANGDVRWTTGMSPYGGLAHKNWRRSTLARPLSYTGPTRGCTRSALCRDRPPKTAKTEKEVAERQSRPPAKRNVVQPRRAVCDDLKRQFEGWQITRLVRCTKLDVLMRFRCKGRVPTHLKWLGEVQLKRLPGAPLTCGDGHMPKRPPRLRLVSASTGEMTSQTNTRCALSRRRASGSKCNWKCCADPSPGSVLKWGATPPARNWSPHDGRHRRTPWDKSCRTSDTNFDRCGLSSSPRRRMMSLISPPDAMKANSWILSTNVENNWAGPTPSASKCVGMTEAFPHCVRVPVS